MPVTKAAVKPKVISARIFTIYFTDLYNHSTVQDPKAVVSCICIAANVEAAIAMAKAVYPGKTVESAHSTGDGYGEGRIALKTILIPGGSR